MKGTYGLDVNENCQSCKLRSNGFFCQLSPSAVKDFDTIRFSTSYPEGALLFMENQTPKGIYILCEGEVKLSVSSREGKTLILRVARAGEVLGLMPGLSGRPHEVTAETLRPCQVAFVRREAFASFLNQHPEVFQAVIAQLGGQYETACQQLRTVGLSTSAPERLAKLLLEMSAGGQQTKEGTRVSVPLTHEEIGECIGTTRETVTRTISQFKSGHLIDFRGATLIIQNRSALQQLVAT